MFRIFFRERSSAILFFLKLVCLGSVLPFCQPYKRWNCFLRLSLWMLFYDVLLSRARQKFYLESFILHSCDFSTRSYFSVKTCCFFTRSDSFELSILFYTNRGRYCARQRWRGGGDISSFRWLSNMAYVEWRGILDHSWRRQHWELRAIFEILLRWRGDASTSSSVSTGDRVRLTFFSADVLIVGSRGEVT